MSVIATGHLRGALPDWETDPELDAQWREALSVIDRLGVRGVSCAMGIDTREMLFKVIRAAGCKTVLDIGTFLGTSALAYALAVGPDGKVVTVDIRDANDAPDSHWRLRERPQSPRDMLEAAGVLDRVEFVTQDSVEYLKHTWQKFDFVSIDGWHDPRGVYAEIPLSLARINDGGFMFLDDMQPPGFKLQPGLDTITGPWEAVMRHVKEGLLVRIERPLPDVAVAFLLPT
jgi:predicted O-methyltransferase YrrM